MFNPLTLKCLNPEHNANILLGVVIVVLVVLVVLDVAKGVKQSQILNLKT